MPAYDFTTLRLFVDHPLRAGDSVSLDSAQAHYLIHVMRMAAGDGLLAFNGVDGEWRCRVADVRKRGAALAVDAQTRPQVPGGDLHYLFAPLKRSRLDYMVQKAVEMGVARLVPVVTRHTQAERVNVARMRANAIEAAEQCGVLTLPRIDDPKPLDLVVSSLEPSRHLVFCDEDAPITDPVTALSGIAHGDPIAVLVGPEGGFSAEERAMLLDRSRTLRLALGPRILRADTAAVAALTLVQAVGGDWR
jgi:16S rRNA (uracil1498-N3)-methyltransferase